MLTLYSLFSLLTLLILLSAFFSGTETAVMSVNRYRLRHLARKKHKAALRLSRLLKRPDRLLGVILLGNTFANIFAAAVATIIAVHFWGDLGAAFATIFLTLVILVFAETTPKTYAALHPEKVAFWVSLPLQYLLTIFYPLVWLISSIANAVLTLLRIKVAAHGVDQLSKDELRTVVDDATRKVTEGYQKMLLSILDLETLTVNDIMIPRQDVAGIDTNEEWSSIIQKLENSRHTRLLVYRDSMDHIEGVLHLRRALNIMACGRLTKEALLALVGDAYFIPEQTPLNVQLVNFQQKKRRIGLVVDEYGDILGIVTLEDILEEIVGEFTTDFAAENKYISQQHDGSYLVDASLTVREINRELNWQLSMEGPKTLSGLIIEELEDIPQSNSEVKLNGYMIKVVQVKENRIQIVRIWPKKNEQDAVHDHTEAQ